MFNEKQDDVLCDKCLKNTPHTQTVSYASEHSNKFMIVRINLSMIKDDENIRYNMKIKNFNPFNVEIPGKNLNLSLNSVIVHDKLSENVGHFTCIVHNEDKWYSISDTNSWCIKNLNENLENYYVLLLQKASTNLATFNVQQNKFEESKKYAILGKQYTIEEIRELSSKSYSNAQIGENKNREENSKYLFDKIISEECTVSHKRREIEMK